MKISHNHLEDCLRQTGLQVEEDKKEWEHYVSYIKSIDKVLQKRGLRYGKKILCVFLKGSEKIKPLSPKF
jgi:hypothetical protein